MCIANFNPPIQFVGEKYVESSSDNKKNHPKNPLFLGCDGGCRKTKKLKPHKRHVQYPYKMYLPNFNLEADDCAG